MTQCRILMIPLTKSNEIVMGYTNKGLKALTGSSRINPRLNFTRKQFIHELPKRQKGMSISGYQPKLQMVLNDREFAIVEHQGEYLLKPSPDEFPHLAENEHATMTVMARLGFDVPPHGLLSFKPEQPNDELEFAFVIRRFDRDEKMGTSIHQEQLDGAMGIQEKFGKIKTEGKQYVSYEQVALFLIQHVNDNIKFKMDLFRRIVYAYLLGNNDLHLRNFSLIHPNTGKPTLAPVYDFVSVAPYKEYFSSCFLALPLLVQEEGDKELAPGFETKYGEYLGIDFLIFGQSMGLSEKLIRKLLMDLTKETQLIESTYRNSFMPKEAIKATLQCYQQRLNRIQVLDT